MGQRKKYLCKCYISHLQLSIMDIRLCGNCCHILITWGYVSSAFRQTLVDTGTKLLDCLSVVADANVDPQEMWDQPLPCLLRITVLNSPLSNYGGGKRR